MAMSRLTPEEQAEQDLQRWRQGGLSPEALTQQDKRLQAQGGMGTPPWATEWNRSPILLTGGTTPERDGVQQVAAQPGGRSAPAGAPAPPTTYKESQPLRGNAPPQGGTQRPAGDSEPTANRRNSKRPSQFDQLELRRGLATQEVPVAGERAPVPRGRVDGSDGSMVQDYFKRDIHRPRTGLELTRDYAFGLLKGPAAVGDEDALAKEVVDRAQAGDIPLPAVYANAKERKEGQAVYPLMERYDRERIGPKFLRLYAPPTDAFAEAAGAQPIPAISNGYNTPARRAEAMIGAARDWKYFPEWARKQGITLTPAQLATYRHAAAARTLEALKREDIDGKILGNLVVLYVTNELGGVLGEGLGLATPWLASKAPWIARAAATLDGAAMRQAPTLTRWAKQIGRSLDVPGAVRSGTVNAVLGAGTQQLEDPQADFQKRLRTFGHNFAGGAAFHSGLHASGVVRGKVSGKARGTVADVRAAIQRRREGKPLPNGKVQLPDPDPPLSGVQPNPETTAPEPQPGAVGVSGGQPTEPSPAKRSQVPGSGSGLSPDTIIADLKARDYGEQEAWTGYLRSSKGKPELSPEEFRRRFLEAKPKRHLLPEIQAPAVEEARYLAEGLDESRGRYSGRFNIEKRKSLTPEERAIEAAFAARLEAHPEAFLQEYLRLHGNQINTDLAKELWPDFVASPEGRIKSSNAIYAPAKRLASLAYERLLAEAPSAGRRKTVLFTAGGPGAGKSTAIAGVPTAQQAQDAAHIVVDGTLSDYRLAKEMIDRARGAGHTVKVIYVHRPAALAAVGTMLRARDPKKGWPVPYRRIAEGHFGAQNTVLQLKAEYGDQIDILPLDNSGTLHEISDLDLSRLGDERYTDLESLSRRIRDALEAEYDASVQRGEPLPYDLFKAFLGDDGRRVGPGAPGRNQGELSPRSPTSGRGSGEGKIGNNPGKPGDPEPPANSGSKPLLGIVGAATGLGIASQQNASGGNDRGGVLLTRAVRVRGSLKHDTYVDTEGKKRTAKWYVIGNAPEARVAMATYLLRRRPELVGRTWFIPGVGSGTLETLLVERGVMPAKAGNVYRQEGQKWRSGGGRAGAGGGAEPPRAGGYR